MPLIWTECGIFNRYWLVCPLCQRTVRLLYGIDERCACQRCAKLRHASRLKSAAGRKFLRARKIRLRLGGMPLLHTGFRHVPATCAVRLTSGSRNGVASRSRNWRSTPDFPVIAADTGGPVATLNRNGKSECRAAAWRAI